MDQIEQHVKPPLRVMHVNKYYPVAIYEEFKVDDPQIIGVDVSGGYRRDSSAFAAISSRTTKVQAVFNNNRIGINEFSQLLHSYIRNYSPNALLVIERNSYGEGIISNLRKTSVSSNLYYAFKKDDTRDRLNDGFKNDSSTILKEYGVYTTQKVREAMMDLLRDRVRDHYDKFVAYTILDEMKGLIFDPKKGRIDHGTETHDDTIMALMMALYVYYYGTNLTAFGISKRDVRRYNEELATEDMSSRVQDPIGMVDNYLTSMKMPTTKSIRAYYNKLESERLRELDAVDNYLQTKSLIGTGKVGQHLFNTGSTKMFRDLNNVDELEEMDIFNPTPTKDENGMYVDFLEDNMMKQYEDYRNGIDPTDSDTQDFNKIYYS